MLQRRSYVIGALLGVLFGPAAGAAHAQTPSTPGASRIYSTIYSVGVEWDIAGDDNHDASATVQYRVQGAGSWTAALPLVRIDYNGANMLAGSILFLTPETAYEVNVSLYDPDGGAETRTLSVATRLLPVLPQGRTLHVVPGTGGGDGSAANPFQGIAAGQAAAQPGDTLLLHSGSYGGRIRFDKPGTAANYLVWKAFGDGEVLMNGIDIAASHIWLEGLTVRNQTYATFSINAPENVVVRRCRFYNNHYSIYLQQGGRYWYIADNTIVGNTAYTTESLAGEGIELNTTSGHTVAFNSITNVADGISYPLTNVDIFGNDIFDTSDDGIEPDYGAANVRMWGNRIHNAVHNGISFQPQNGGPWYIIRNQIVLNKEAAFKFRTTDRFVLLHNTIVNWGKGWADGAMMCCNEGHLLRAIARNNLWIAVQGGQIWGFDATLADWRSDLDFDGFDWGAATNPFKYAGVTFPDIASFSGASNMERHGIRVAGTTCFETFDVPSPPPAPVPAQVMTLRSDCNAVDAGAVLPNINDSSFAGAAPDLGAYEYGQPAPPFGPRVGPTARLTTLAGTIRAGQSTTLVWTTTDATTVTIDQSVGAVDPHGSLIVSPTSTTTYTITASGPEGLTTADATVIVSAGETVPSVPSGPTDLVAQAPSSTSIALAWTDTASNEEGFVVERSEDGTTFSRVATLGPDTATFTDTGLTSSRTYLYRVAAYNAAGQSPYSGTVAATTLQPELGAPGNLSAIALSSTRIHLSWRDNAGAEAGYRIERASSGGAFSQIGTVGPSVETYTDATVKAGKKYSYRVRAYSGGANSAYSNTATVTTPRK
jgi:Right handed beta helix region/Fibronectin type III domain